MTDYASASKLRQTAFRLLILAITCSWLFSLDFTAFQRNFINKWASELTKNQNSQRIHFIENGNNGKSPNIKRKMKRGKKLKKTEAKKKKMKKEVESFAVIPECSYQRRHLGYDAWFRASTSNWSEINRSDFEQKTEGKTSSQSKYWV